MAETARTRWLVLVLLFAGRTGLGFQFQTMGSVSDAVVADLGLNYTQIGTLIGLFMVPGMFLSLPAGFAGRYMSDRFIVGAGLLTMAGGGALASAAASFEMLALGRFVCGVGFVVSTIFFTKIIADWFAGRELATAMSILVMSWPFGIAAGQVGHGWLAEHFDWRWAFAAAAIYCLIAGLLVMFLCREAPDAARPAGGLRFTLSRQEIVLTLIAACVWALFNAGYVVYLSFAPRVLVAGGYETVPALGVISLASWIMIFSGAICGQIVDRTGKADVVLYICMMCAIVALFALFVIPLAIPSSLLFGLAGMAPAGVIIALSAQASKPENRALGMGLFFSVYFVVQAPAPAIAGWLYDLTAEEFWPILFAALLFLLTAVSNFVFRIVQRRGVM